MGVKYLIDTNIIIYILKKEIPERELEKISNIIDTSLNISAISKVETLGWSKLKGQDKIITEEFIKTGRNICNN